MKKVLIVATVGGFLGFELNDIQILKEMGYEVHCASNFSFSMEHRAVIKLKEMQDVVLHQITFSRNPISKDNFIAYKEIKKLMRKENFSLIHCHTPVGGVVTRIAARKYRKKGTKVIYTAHGFHFFEGAPLKNWLLYYPIEWLCSWWTDMLITINTEDYKRGKNKLHAKEIAYIPGVGVDVKKFSSASINRKEKRQELNIPQNAFVLLSVGELANRKNHQIVINALGKIENNNIYYLIVGTGERESFYKTLIEKNNLKDTVKLLGRRDDIAQLCKMADCFVHPSIREGLGIAPLEAMAVGLPLISANVNGIRDYTEDGKSGCCVNPFDIDEMVAAINKMYSDSKFRDSCIFNNQEKVKKFDINETKKIMVDLYKRFDK